MALVGGVSFWLRRWMPFSIPPRRSTTTTSTCTAATITMSRRIHDSRHKPSRTIANLDAPTNTSTTMLIVPPTGHRHVTASSGSSPRGLVLRHVDHHHASASSGTIGLGFSTLQSTSHGLPSSTGSTPSQRFFSTTTTTGSTTTPPYSPEPSQSRVDATFESNGIVRVILNRPHKLNAMDLQMFYDIRDTIQQLHQQQSKMRVILLSGNGRAFCSGLDVKSVFGSGNPITTSNILLERPTTDPNLTLNDSPKDDTSSSQLSNLSYPNLAQQVAYGWRTLPVPVIAIVHGACFGAGLQLALGADIRIATADAKLGLLESKYGIIPDMSASVTLRELVRIDVAKELTFTGRILSGIEAGQLGLVTHVVETQQDAIDKAHELAQSLLDKSPDAIASAKQLFHTTYTNATHDDCLRIEATLQRRLLATWNQLAASGRSLLGWKVPYW